MHRTYAVSRITQAHAFPLQHNRTSVSFYIPTYLKIHTIYFMDRPFTIHSLALAMFSLYREIIT